MNIPCWGPIISTTATSPADLFPSQGCVDVDDLSSEFQTFTIYVALLMLVKICIRAIYSYKFLVYWRTQERTFWTFGRLLRETETRQMRKCRALTANELLNRSVTEEWKHIRVLLVSSCHDLGLIFQTKCRLSFIGYLWAFRFICNL